VRPPRRNPPDPADAPDERAIRAAAVALLARREHCTQELRSKLGQRGYDATAIDTVLADLARRGLVSDERFATAFVRQRVERGQGPVRIRAELRALGLDAAYTDAALEDADIDWPERAARVRRRRFGTRVPGSFAERAKQARFLQYRGFTAEQVRAALGDERVDVDYGSDD
jgi:regulatory protein